METGLISYFATILPCLGTDSVSLNLKAASPLSDPSGRQYGLHPAPARPQPRRRPVPLPRRPAEHQRARRLHPRAGRLPAERRRLHSGAGRLLQGAVRAHRVSGRRQGRL